MANRLAGESSPYLRQHAHNPVDWYPWGDEACEKARREEKPVFLSIGYSSCHWCHVMERESFENEEIARTLNEHWVSVKVDREERPDIDDVSIMPGGSPALPRVSSGILTDSTFIELHPARAVGPRRPGLRLRRVTSFATKRHEPSRMVRASYHLKLKLCRSEERPSGNQRR